MGNACGEAFLEPSNSPLQGSGFHGQGGDTAAWYGSQGRYCSHVPAPSATPGGVQGAPTIHWTQAWAQAGDT